tara:strand:+ start:1730 stop:2347 length:618 start_codon:yes stop_codon:yes gene_type:complete
MKYFLMLLFIGLMWGQEYDTMTGEPLKRLYNPETGELIEDKIPLDSVALPFNSNTKLKLKDISYKVLSKKQKKIFNQNRISIKPNSDYSFLKDHFWSAYIKKGFYKTKRLNKIEFFKITGYPERGKIVEHNIELGIKCALLIPLVSLVLQITDNTSLASATFCGGAFYLLSEYTKRTGGTSFDDARRIAKKYNQDLMVKIYNENN